MFIKWEKFYQCSILIVQYQGDTAVVAMSLNEPMIQ